MLRALAVSLLLLGLAPYAGCDAAAGDPTEDDLVGLWVNVDAGTVRAFEFVAASSDPALASKPYAYTLYSYAEGQGAVVVQRGHYAVKYGRLVTSVVEAPLDPSQAGKDYGNDLLAWSDRAFTLGNTSGPNGERVFTRAAGLP
ncbi:MAG: hypothetical protein EP329_14180 [Deltaproteobacteria bacterium]|nr:MAG: hypothetical protein EP329_14180 [Deltaproteobacteria bacterium]